MKFKIAILSLSFLMVFSFSFAQSSTDLGVAAGLTPKSTFYFLDQWSEWLTLRLTFNRVKNIERQLEYANERVAEAKALQDSGDLKKDYAEKLKRAYQKLTENAVSQEQKIKIEGKDVSELVKKIEDISSRHTAVLQKVLDKVPEEARDAIEHALEVSKRGHEQAIESIQKEVEEGTIKEEELDEDVREEVRNKSRKQEEEKSIDSLEINIEEDQKSLEAHMEDLNKSELNDLDSDLNTLERGIK